MWRITTTRSTSVPFFSKPCSSLFSQTNPKWKKKKSEKNMSQPTKNLSADCYRITNITFVFFFYGLHEREKLLPIRGFFFRCKPQRLSFEKVRRFYWSELVHESTFGWRFIMNWMSPSLKHTWTFLWYVLERYISSGLISCYSMQRYYTQPLKNDDKILQ